MADLDVVVIGGGISGLTAARALCRRGLQVRLLEREPMCGGVIRTDRVGDFVIDAGPDTLLAHKPAALALVRELGLTESLVAPLPRRTTYVVRRSALRTLPETSAMGLPTNWHTLITANAFSWHGKLRMAAEALLPPRPPAGDDESISSFVRRRFGDEAVRYVAEPLLAGLHRGDAARLSLRALFPVLADAERRHGSVARAWRTMPAGAGRRIDVAARGSCRAPGRDDRCPPSGRCRHRRQRCRDRAKRGWIPRARTRPRNRHGQDGSVGDASPRHEHADRGTR